VPSGVGCLVLNDDVDPEAPRVEQRTMRRIHLRGAPSW
jgi:hypothetical protein